MARRAFVSKLGQDRHDERHKRLSCVVAIKWPAVRRAYERLLKLDQFGQDYGDKRSNQGGYDAD